MLCSCEGCSHDFEQGDYIYWPISGADEPLCDMCHDALDRAFEYERTEVDLMINNIDQICLDIVKLEGWGRKVEQHRPFDKPKPYWIRPSDGYPVLEKNLSQHFLTDAETMRMLEALILEKEVSLFQHDRDGDASLRRAGDQWVADKLAYIVIEAYKVMLENSKNPPLPKPFYNWIESCFRQESCQSPT